MTQVIKIKIEDRFRDELTVTVFSGLKDTTLQNTGQLVLNVTEYQLFAVALMLGSEKMRDHLEVVIENEKRFGV